MPAWSPYCPEFTARSPASQSATDHTATTGPKNSSRAAYDSSATSLTVKVTSEAGSVLVNATNANTFSAQTCSGASCGLVLAGTLGANGSDYIDQLVISSDPARDLYGDFAFTRDYP